MPLKLWVAPPSQMSRAAVVDVCMDDDFNIFALGSLAGRPHVMSCSLFGQGGGDHTIYY